MTKSMKFSAKFGKFMFYSSDLDDLRFSEAGGKDICKHGFPDDIFTYTGIPCKLFRSIFQAEYAAGI